MMGVEPDGTGPVRLDNVRVASAAMGGILPASGLAGSRFLLLAAHSQHPGFLVVTVGGMKLAGQVESVQLPL